MSSAGIFVLAVAVIALAGAVATFAVIIGIHQEEKRWTLKDGAPTGLAVFARRVLGTHVVMGPDLHSELKAAGASDAFSGR